MKRSKKYWQILGILWGSTIIAFTALALILGISSSVFLYLLFSVAVVAWLAHKLAREYSAGSINRKHYEKAKAIVEDMQGVDLLTLCMSLDMAYADVCYLLDAMEAEGFITPRRLKFPQ